jgi:hypothetical protein
MCTDLIINYQRVFVMMDIGLNRLLVNNCTVVLVLVPIWLTDDISIGMAVRSTDCSLFFIAYYNQMTINYRCLWYWISWMLSFIHSRPVSRRKHFYHRRLYERQSKMPHLLAIPFSLKLVQIYL